MTESIVRRRSLRRRLMWAFTLLTTLALITQAIALYVSSEEQEEDLIDELVETALDRIVGHADNQVPSLLGRHLSFFRGPIGSVPAGLPASFSKLPIGKHEWFSNGTEFHVGVRELAGERLYLLYDASDHEERLTWLLWALIAGVLIISSLSLWLGHWFAKLLVGQLEQLTSNLAADDQTLLIRPEQDREVALLAKALDDYRARNAALIAREREFTANVSHELRTPLTRIRTGAELIVSGSNDTTRAQRIVLAVDELERRLKGLLFLARSSAQPIVARLALSELANGLVEPHHENCAARGITLENRISPEVMLEADPDLLLLLIDNLLRNAVKFTESGTISLSFEDGWLKVCDTGIGIPENQLELVFERHFQTDQRNDGCGLGLHIVREIAERCGWRCEIKSEPAKGTEIKIQLVS